MNIVEYSDREALMMGLSDSVASELRAALAANDTATLCVPGGSSPGPVFDTLSGVSLDWARVGVVLNDERLVPETSSRSNTRLIRERLLVEKAAVARFVSFIPVTGDPSDVDAEAQSEAVRPWLPITTLILGMGDDMHTASRFPGGDNLERALEQRDPPLITMRAEGAGETRITLTAPVLREAMHTHLLIMGEGKRDAFERARSLPPEQAPIRALLAEATVHWAA